MNFSNKKDEKREPYTVDECQSCNKESKHKFKESSKCISCEGQMMIVKIFGELVNE